MKIRLCIRTLVLLSLAGCSQYTTPTVHTNGATADTLNAPGNGVSGRSADPLNTQSDPNATTGSVGGSPGGTASAQTVPSSSDGVR